MCGCFTLFGTQIQMQRFQTRSRIRIGRWRCLMFTLTVQNRFVLFSTVPFTFAYYNEILFLVVGSTLQMLIAVLVLFLTRAQQYFGSHLQVVDVVK